MSLKENAAGLKAREQEYIGVLIKARTIAEAWEKTVIKCWENGVEIPTEYGENSKEILGLLIIVEEPFSEPRVHRGDIYTAIRKSLKKYIDEVLEGTLDQAVKEGKIHYTYHERLFNYPPNGINQVEYIVEKLRKVSFSRRAQAITWIPEKDMWADSPPCLQRIWFTIRKNRLMMHATWRSRDVFRAMHMNMLAMTELQKRIAEKLNVKVGAYLDFSNSAHIYERSYSDVERFINVVKNRRSKANRLKLLERTFYSP